jgi:energy-coupling factor transporter ATP-binding protein EcfA2
MTPAAEVRNLRFGYDDVQDALRGISFSVAPGECLGIVGPNGAGKSTLLLHLNGVLPDEPSADSSVLIDGQPITKANLPEIRRNVGLLFQDPDDQIFCPTVFEDVSFGPTQLGVSETDLVGVVRAALAQVRLDGFENRLPHHLSLGEKRRVCLAGVLACQPKILVLDEPTAGLDPRGRRELTALLASFPATRIVASHDLDMVAALCSRVIVLDRGAVVASGPTVEVLSDESLMLAHGLERPHSLQHRHPHDRVSGSAG